MVGLGREVKRESVRGGGSERGAPFVPRFAGDSPALPPLSVRKLVRIVKLYVGGERLGLSELDREPSSTTHAAEAARVLPHEGDYYYRRHR